MSNPELQVSHANGSSEVLWSRFLEICRMTDEMIAKMPPAKRDRMLQTHLAAARGPAGNFKLLCELTDAFAPIRRQRLEAQKLHG